MFSKKPTPKEQIRQNDRALKKTQRDLERDRGDLDKQEKQIEMQIKQAAKQGNKQACTTLAKQLVNLRKQKTKSYAMGSRIQSIGNQQKVMHSNMKMATAMGTATKGMASMNKVMDPQKTAAMMQQFEKESMKMEMTEDVINDTMDEVLGESGDEEEQDAIVAQVLVNDTMDEVLGESGDEEEQDAIVAQVLDEIGIDMAGKMAAAPEAHKGKLGESSKAASKGLSDADIERQLAALKDL